MARIVKLFLLQNFVSSSDRIAWKPSIAIVEKGRGEELFKNFDLVGLIN